MSPPAPRTSKREEKDVALVEISWADALAARAAGHHLDVPLPREQLLEVPRDVCGIHAQLLSSAELAAWARCEAVRENDLAAELWEKRTLMKTWAMRDTLHLLPADEIGLYLSALRPGGYGLSRAWLKYLGVTAEEMEAITEAVPEVLDGRELMREQLADEIGRVTRTPSLGAKVLESWGDFLKPAAARGYLCFGPSEGRNVTFARPDQWIGPWKVLDPHAAQTEIARRYLGAYGPATREDFGRWFGMDPRRAQTVLESVGDDAVEVSVEGSKAWMARAALDVRPAPADAVRLLPAFDPYVAAAYLHCEHLLPPDAKKKVYRPQGWMSPVVLVGGRFEAVWKRETKRRVVHVSVEPLGKLSRAIEREIAAEARRLGDFLSSPTEVAIGT